jgi:CRP-like cAMP-binding protein
MNTSFIFISQIGNESMQPDSHLYQTGEKLARLSANTFLAALPEPTLTNLLPFLEISDYPLRSVLIIPKAPIRHVYFPLDGICSLVNSDKHRKGVEVGIIGRDGIIGHTVLMGTNRSLQRGITEIPIVAAQMSAKEFLVQAQRDKALESVTFRFADAFFNQVTQVSACRGLHTAREQLGRWLLMCHDLMKTDSFLLKEECISEMLGVRRPTVVRTVGMLEEEGFIRYSQGTVTVLNRKGLEESSCDCYRILRETGGFDPTDYKSAAL